MDIHITISIVFIIVLLARATIKGDFKKTAYTDLAFGTIGVAMALTMYLSDGKLAPAWMIAFISWIVIGRAWNDLKKK